ncbi:MULTISPECIES: hypothetical protein [unclassified Corynebacterium]|uniref:hypothetical protein n=1 Tax=unclassified Corynebacterium TaxID=2624378 RepID=UPI0008A2659C|nr:MULTISPECIES: hypothetical protein [unclassified Corynebacterium]OHR23252.1 hypothetical protein HMPREF2791_05570 [Corynebacterium sp. HMSC034A01]
MFKNFGDSIVNYVDGTATDEFEAATYHKASSVGFYTSLIGMALVGAILAWVLPGRQALWSAIVLLIPLISSAASTQWMRNYVASPVIRLRDTPRGVLVIYFALCAVWLAGLIVTGGFDPSGGFDSAGATGAIVGAIIGAVVAGVVSQRISKRRRQRDQARLDAEAGD